MLAVRVWNWNEWCRNMRLKWRLRAQQHLVILSHVFITADTGLLDRLAHTQEEESADTSPLTMLPDEPLTPGISRFEQLLRHLIAQIMPSIRRRYSSGPLQIIVQTNGSDKDRESQSFYRIWSAGSPPWKAEIHFQDADSSFDGWNQFVASTKRPVLVLAMHYRLPNDVLPEFASALFLMPPSMLNPGEQKMHYGFSGRCRSTPVCLQRNSLNYGIWPSRLPARNTLSGTVGSQMRQDSQ